MKSKATNKDEIPNTGVKIGSTVTAIAQRDQDGKIILQEGRTCIWYPDSVIKTSADKIIVGEEATKIDDAINPMKWGVVKNEEGIKHTADILRYLHMPTHGRVVLASPAVQMKDGNDRLSMAIRDVCTPHNGKIRMFSEGLCSAVYIGGMETIKESTIFTLNLGSTTFEVGAFKRINQKHLSAHSEVSGNRVDAKIRTLVSNVSGDAIITDWDIRNMKETASLVDQETFQINAMTNGGRKTIEVLDEVLLPIGDYARSVAGIFCEEVFETIDTTIRNQALKSPLYISGGMANIPGVTDRIIDIINERLNIRFELATSKDGDNHTIAAKGALMLAEAIAEEEANGGE